MMHWLAHKNHIRVVYIGIKAIRHLYWWLLNLSGLVIGRSNTLHWACQPLARSVAQTCLKPLFRTLARRRLTTA